MTFTALDLFAGIGGFSRAVHWLGGTTVGFVEWDSWNRRVLAKHWPEAHFHGDIRTFTADTLREWGIRTHGGRAATVGNEGRARADAACVLGAAQQWSASDGVLSVDGTEPRSLDLLTGGYPCQPFSHAGKRLGAADDRHLWPEMRRVINLTRPRWVLAENVAGHVSMGLDTVLAELEADGYTCGAVVVPACAVNALHRRDRVWILASLADASAERPTARGQREIDPGEMAGGRAYGGRGDGDAAGPAPCRGAGQDTGGVADAEGERGWTDARGVGEGAAAALRDAKREGHVVGWPGWREREPCGDGATDRGRAERQIVGPVDPRSYGISTGLVRRPAARSAWDDPDVIRAMWADGSWEADLPRVVAEEAERRQKLQAAGNAIVPIVAYEILRVMLGGEADRA